LAEEIEVLPNLFLSGAIITTECVIVESVVRLVEVVAKAVVSFLKINTDIGP
jgi:hypothetical protein